MSFEQDVSKQIWQIKNQLTKHDGAIEFVKQKQVVDTADFERRI